MSESEKFKMSENVKYASRFFELYVEIRLFGRVLWSCFLPPKK